MAVDLVILLFFNNFYLKDPVSFSVSKIVASSSKAAPTNIQIDEGASGFQVSHDGEYLAYLLNGTIVIESLSGEDKMTVHHEDQMQIASLKWIYDRDRLMIAETSTSGGHFGKFYYIDMSDKNVVEVRDNYFNKDISIPLYNNRRSITEIDISAETNLMFFKVSYGSSSCRLWESNIMVSTNALSRTVTDHIGSFVCLKRTETLFYEDQNNGRVYEYDTQKSIRIGNHTQFAILGVDDEDNLYLASNPNGSVGAIYYGNAKTGSFQKLDVVASKGSPHYYLTYTGSVLEDLPASHTMVNLHTRASTAYTGSVIGVYDEGFLTKTNNTVFLNRYQ